MIIMRELDKKAIEAASYRWNHIAKPLHGLGVLEDDIIRIAGMTGSPDICLDRKAVVIMCADNGRGGRGSQPDGPGGDRGGDQEFYERQRQRVHYG